MKNLIEAVGVIVGLIATLLFLSFLLSWPVMMLWNGCLVGLLMASGKSHGYRLGDYSSCLVCCSGSK